MHRVRRKPCKLFLCGLSPNTTESDIRHGMSKFGMIDKVVIKRDSETKKCRGFGFLSFVLEESNEQACTERYVIINGKQIVCKRAEHRTIRYNMPRNDHRSQLQISPMAPTHQNNWNSTDQSSPSFQGSSVSRNYTNVQAANVHRQNITVGHAEEGSYGSKFFCYAPYNKTPIELPPRNAVSPHHTYVPSMQRHPTTYGRRFPTSAASTPRVFMYIARNAVPRRNVTASYMQRYPPTYGSPVHSNYSYSPIPIRDYYAEWDSMNAQVSGFRGENIAVGHAEEGLYADYAPTSSYTPSRYVSIYAYGTQNAPSTSSYQRFHPYAK